MVIAPRSNSFFLHVESNRRTLRFPGSFSDSQSVLENAECPGACELESLRFFFWVLQIKKITVFFEGR